MWPVGISAWSSKCPQRLGISWSSSWIAAAPARSSRRTVRMALSGPPYPVSASTTTGSRVASVSRLDVVDDLAAARSGRGRARRTARWRGRRRWRTTAANPAASTRRAPRASVTPGSTSGSSVARAARRARRRSWALGIGPTPVRADRSSGMVLLRNGGAACRPPCHGVRRSPGPRSAVRHDRGGASAGGPAVESVDTHVRDRTGDPDDRRAHRRGHQPLRPDRELEAALQRGRRGPPGDPAARQRRRRHRLEQLRAQHRGAGRGLPGARARRPGLGRLGRRDLGRLRPPGRRPRVHGRARHREGRAGRQLDGRHDRDHLRGALPRPHLAPHHDGSGQLLLLPRCSARATARARV